MSEQRTEPATIAEARREARREEREACVRYLRAEAEAIGVPEGPYTKGARDALRSAAKELEDEEHHRWEGGGEAKTSEGRVATAGANRDKVGDPRSPSLADRGSEESAPSGDDEELAARLPSIGDDDSIDVDVGEAAQQRVDELLGRPQATASRACICHESPTRYLDCPVHIAMRRDAEHELEVECPDCFRGVDDDGKRRMPRRERAPADPGDVMLVRFADWIARHLPWGVWDHACEQCVPGGDVVVEGFQCVPHMALALTVAREPTGSRTLESRSAEAPPEWACVHGIIMPVPAAMCPHCIRFAWQEQRRERPEWRTANGGRDAG